MSKMDEASHDRKRERDAGLHDADIQLYGSTGHEVYGNSTLSGPVTEGRSIHDNGNQQQGRADLTNKAREKESEKDGHDRLTDAALNGVLRDEQEGILHTGGSSCQLAIQEMDDLDRLLHGWEATHFYQTSKKKLKSGETHGSYGMIHAQGKSRDSDGRERQTDKTGTSIQTVGKQTLRNGRVKRNRGFIIGTTYVSLTMTKEEAQHWVQGTDGIFPPDDVAEALRRYYGRYYVRDTLELGGLGLFASCNIKSGDLIGIYAGTKTTSPGEYVMEIGGNLIDGTPPGEDRLFMMSRINDWYWGGAEQNCKLQEGGIIVATLLFGPWTKWQRRSPRWNARV